MGNWGRNVGKSLTNACFCAVSRWRMVSINRRARSMRSSLKYPASTTALTAGRDAASWVSIPRMTPCMHNPPATSLSGPLPLAQWCYLTAGNTVCRMVQRGNTHH